MESHTAERILKKMIKLSEELTDEDVREAILIKNIPYTMFELAILKLIKDAKKELELTN